MKVSIKKNIYDFEFDTLLGALYLFETSQHRVYDGGSVFDLYVLWYAILTLCNEGMTLTFQEFSNALNDPKLLKRIQDYYIERTQAIADLAEEENGEQPDEGKKKD